MNCPLKRVYIISGSGSPLVISLAVAGGFIMAIVTISVIYKKRDSFREIIIDKATVVKSNSYKSTLGGINNINVLWLLILFIFF